MPNLLDDDGPYVHLFWMVATFSFVLLVLGIASVALTPVFGFIPGLTLGAVLLAVFHLTAMWAVLGPGSYGKTATLSLMAGALLSFAGLLGVGIGMGPPTLPEMLRLVAVGPAIWLLAQLPYLFLRLALQWRITLEDERTKETITIKELMIFTAAAGGSIALLKVATGNEVDGRELMRTFVFPTAIGLGASFLLVCWPVLAFGFGGRDSRFPISRIVLTALPILALPLLLGVGYVNQWLIIYLWPVFVFVAAFVIPVVIHNRNGFAMVRRTAIETVVPTTDDQPIE